MRWREKLPAVAASATRRAAAARVRRNGGTQQAAADAAKISLRQFKRWEQEDDFKNLIHGRGVLQVGPITIQANHDDAIDTDAEMSMLWVALGRKTLNADGTPGPPIPPEVLGSLIVSDSTLLRAVFIMPRDVDAVRADIQARTFPITPDARTAVLPAIALQALQDPDELRSVCRLFAAPQRQAFDEWLKTWKYRNAEQKAVLTLDALWPGQERLADMLCSEPHVYALKARKLGFTEVSLAYAGFVARVRDQNARVALYSYRERAANDLLAKVRFGLDNLPPHLRLPFAKETTLKNLEYDSGTDDVRVVTAYPTSAASSIETTSTHACCDEWAHWEGNERALAALEPTFSAPGCTSALLTTGVGPADFSSEYWRRCRDGDGLHTSFFTPATARPDRTAEWLERKRKTMTKAAFRTEYALEESDALSGSQGFYFQEEDIERITMSTPGHKLLARADKAKPMRKHTPADLLYGYRLITGIDIGVKDATVLVTLLVSRNGMLAVVNFERYTGLSYPEIQARIDNHASTFPRAMLAIEQNSMGITVIQNLKTPSHRIIPFTTSALSKATAIEALASALEGATLFAHEDDCPQLFRELRGYQVPDEYVQQDCVMALAIAIKCAPKMLTQGRVLGVFNF
jgi:hypothetical protein